MNKAILEFHNVTIGRSSDPLFDKLNFSVFKEEVTGIWLPRAGGKSTLFSVIVGLKKPLQGKITRSYRTVGFVPQNVTVYRELTVEENLRFIGSLHGIDSVKLQANIESLLEQCHLVELKKVLADDLLSAKGKFLQLACALIYGPDLLVFDDATQGMTEEDCQRFWNIITTYRSENRNSGNKKKATVLFLSHDEEEIMKSTRAISIHRHKQEVSP
ncbi:ATP-binding cassette domain-containing protein [Heliorestis convoluta]|uniref:ABC transporter family protein n=1 Tax=Heliorestis convoluta TaxID=356322 RepID=A0A5Q2MZU4_9FIRM|nr:ATP-binding cassette domain-containing protein [Heliorestis convoluta]QGG46973.1 ABC transporter family protein [Heliorestis convoluta]